jgi:predicted dehydrogenase
MKSRRDFITTVGGAALLASAARAQGPRITLPDLPKKKLGWAVVGLGQLSVNQILPALTQCKRSRLGGLVSGSPEKARHLAQVYGLDPKHIYSYESYDRIVNDPEIDVVYIVLPNSMHAEYTIRALKAGKHVLCEKPMATTVADSEAMIAEAKRAARKLMIAYRLHFEPFNLALTKFALDDSELGSTRFIMADAGFNIGDPAQWRLRRKLSGGGALMDIGLYSLQAARYLSGQEPTELSAMTHATPGDPRFDEVEELVTFSLRFPSGILANCSGSFGAGINRFRVAKQRGWAELDPAMNYSGLRMRVSRGGVIEERPQRVVDHFGAEMDHFSECVIENKEPKTPGEEGLRDMRLMMAIYESARERKIIRLA